jgi:hypothetical protein
MKQDERRPAPPNVPNHVAISAWRPKAFGLGCNSLDQGHGLLADPAHHSPLEKSLVKGLIAGFAANA